MFTLFGTLLTGYGLVSDAAIYKKSLGLNINLGWGLVMLSFGAAMLALAWRGRASKADRGL